MTARIARAIGTRSNRASALTRRANKALREAKIEGLKVKCDDFTHGGTVKGPLPLLIIARPVLEAAGLGVSELRTYSWGTEFYIANQGEG